MLSELLPSPELYEDWQSYARALTTALESLANQSASGGDITYVVSNTSIDPANLPPLPVGYVPMWLNTGNAMLYMGNEDYDPPTAPNIVFIDTANIADAAIEANKIAASAVTASAILDGAVGSLELAAAAVTNAKVASNAIGSANIIDLAVVNAKIGTAAVLTANIQDGAIINAKIADATILNAKLVDATIQGAKIANGTIVTALIGDAQIVSAKIGALQVNTGHIANAAIDSAKIANLAVGAAHIQAAVIGTAHLVDAAITNAKIGNTIQSAGWNATTKQGWSMDKTGLIQGSAIAIYDTSGNLVFGSGGTISFSQVTDLNSLISENLIPNGFLSSPALVGWSVSGAVQGVWTVAAVGDPVPTFIRKSDSNSASMGYKSNGGTGFLVRPGENIRFSWFLRTTSTTNSTRINYRYVWTDANGVETIEGSFTSFNTTANVWEEKVAVRTAPAGAVRGRLEWNFVISVVGTVDVGGFRAARSEPGSTVGATIGTNLFGQMTSGNISTFIATAAIGGALIANAAIGTAQIADLSVTTAKIGALAVGSTKIADGAIVAAKIAAGTIIASHFLTDLGVDLGAIVTGALNTAISASQGADVRLPVTTPAQDVTVTVLSIGPIHIAGSGDTLFVQANVNVIQGTPVGNLTLEYSLDGVNWTPNPLENGQMFTTGGTVVSVGMKYWPPVGSGSNPTVGDWNSVMAAVLPVAAGQDWYFRIRANQRASAAGGWAAYVGDATKDYLLRNGFISLRRFFSK